MTSMSLIFFDRNNTLSLANYEKCHMIKLYNAGLFISVRMASSAYPVSSSIAQLINKVCIISKSYELVFNNFIADEINWS